MDRRLVWELSAKCGGVFKFTVLIQKRIHELVRGAPKLVNDPSSDPITIALKEIAQGLIELQPMTPSEIEEMQKSLEEQAAAQTLLAREQAGPQPGEVSTRAITEFLKS